MNNLENLTKGDVINSNGKKKWFAKVLGVDGDDVFITPSYSDFSSALRANSEFQVSKIQYLEESSYTIYTPEPEIKYWSNGAVRSGMKEGDWYFYMNHSGYITYSTYKDMQGDNHRMASKIMFLDLELCETHLQENLDRQALEQKVWEIMDGEEGESQCNFIYHDNRGKYFNFSGEDSDDSDGTSRVTAKARRYLLSDEVTDYQRALWIEDWELAREYKSKE